MKGNERSFSSMAGIIFCLMGLIPYLLSVYLIMQADISITSTVLILAVLTLAIMLLSFLVIRGVGGQLQALSTTTGAIAQGGRVEPIRIEASAPKELHELAFHFNAMIDEMEKNRRGFREVSDRMLAYTHDIDAYKSKLQEEAILRAYLARYVGDDVVERMIRSSKEDPLKNERCEATLLFADIRSFTTLSERMKPEEIIAMLNEYFNAMVDIIFEHGGILDKFVGDELMAVFRSKPDGQRGAMNAVRAAIGMQKRLRDFMRDRNARGLQIFEVGVGINTGQVVMGNVGAMNRMDYTVIGDTVNVAARLEQMAQGQEIIVSESTYLYCKAHVQMRRKGEISVKNRAEPVKCYEVIL